VTDLSSKVAQVTVLVGAADPGKRKVVFGVFQENGKPIFDRSRTIRKCLDYHATTDVLA
jgi:hypothetical protein